MPFCKTVESCEGLGLKSIKSDIEREGLNKVVIAGISPRRYETDMFPDDVIVEKVAIREHVVWCQPPGEEDTQMLAEDYLRMYIAKVQNMQPPEPFAPEDAIDKSGDLGSDGKVANRPITAAVSEAIPPRVCARSNR